MRRSLLKLNGRHLPKALRQALVLLTLLLLPSAAWGQWDTQTFIFYGSADNGLYAKDSDDPTKEYVWLYNGPAGYYGASRVDDKLKITVRDNDGKSVLTPPNLNDCVVKKVTLNYEDLQVTGESKIYVRAVNRTDTTKHYTDPCLMTNEGTMEINLNDEGMSPEDLNFLIFSNDDKAYSYFLNSITITKTEDHHISIGGIPLTGANVSPETGAVTDMEGISFTPATTGAATLSLNNATITGNIEWNMNNGLNIELTGGNTVDGYIYSSNNEAALSITDPTESKSSYLTVGKSEYTGSAIRGFSGVTLANGLNYEEDVKYHASDKVLKYSNGQAEIALVHISYHYGLTIAGVPVTNTNLSAEGTVTGLENIKFDPASGTAPATLTLNNAEIHGTITYNGTSDLTIAFSGTTNSVSTSSEINAIKYEGSASERPKLTFSLTNGSTTGSLNISASYSVIEGFSDVDFGSFNLASTSAQGVYYDNTNGPSMRGHEDSASDLTITTETYYPIWIFNPSQNNTGYPYAQLNKDSKSVTIDDGSISYDGDHTITISNVNFNYGNNTLIVVGPSMEQLTVNLVGQSTTGEATTVLSLWDTTPLTFTTDKDEPGSLTGPSIVSWKNGNGQISCKDGLVFNYDSSTTYTETISTEGSPLQIGNTLISETGEYLDGTISFDANSKKLTLNNATINGNIISALGDLTIHLIGNNSISCYEIQTPILSANSGTLTFETENATNGSLVFLNSGNEVFSGNPIIGFTKVEYGAGLVYDEENQRIGLINYPIQIGSTSVNSQNKTDILGDGKVTYDSENHIITLHDEAAITGPIQWGLPDDLTIALKGTSTITITDGYAIMGTSETTSGLLTIAKAEGASSSKLKIIGTVSPMNNGFDNTSYESCAGEGLYWITLSSESIEITDNPEYVIIEGYPMSDDRTINGTEGTITYDSTAKVLTLNGFQKNYESGEGQIQTGVEGLTIKIVGENNINAAGINILFKAIQNSATIKFVGTTADDNLSMTVGSTTNSAFEGFADGAITYENLVYSGEGYGYTIQAPTAPMIKGIMSGDNPAVEISKEYEDGDIYYTIDYAGETEDVSKTKYEGSFTMAAPGTVTVWVEVNNTTTDEVIGKYFGYIDTPCTIAKGSTKETTIYPLITEDEGFTINYSSQNESIATFANGTITGVSAGTTQVRSSLTTTNSSLEYTILNQMATGVDVSDSYIITIDVTVEELIDENTFTSGQNYGTFYNTSTETYKVPEGLVAYIITGVDGNSITISETKILPPNAPVLFYRTDLENAINYTFTQATSSDGTFPEGNILEYAFGDIPADASSELYVLYNGKFVKVTSGTDIAAKHCYLNLGSTVANTRGFYNIGNGEGTTAIREVKNGEVNSEKWGNGEWFDIQGRHVAQPAKGLYIRNGKKVVIK